jgi:hypothetical protein
MVMAPQGPAQPMAAPAAPVPGPSPAPAEYLDLYPESEDEYRMVLAWAQQAFDAAQKARMPYDQRWTRYYQLYNSYTGARRRGDWRSRVFIPISFSIVETIAPRLVAQLPKFLVNPFGPEDVEVAKRMEQMLRRVSDARVHGPSEMPLYAEMVKATKSALKYGTGILKTYYKQKMARARRMVPVMENETMLMQIPQTDPDGAPLRDLDGNPVVETREEIVGQVPVGQRFERYDYVAYDGPAAEAVDIFNFWVAPEAEDVESARYVIHRVYRPFRYVQRRVDEGVYRWPEGFSLSDFFDQTQDEPHTFKRDAIDLGGSNNDPTRRDVELLEIWTDDGRVITLANRRVVLRVHENAYDHGEKPFVRITDYFQEHEFWGKGEIEAIEHLQDLQNALINQRVDNVRLLMDAVFAVNTSNLEDLADLTMRPGRVIRVKGDLPPADVVQRVDLGEVTESAFAEAESTKRMIEETSGISSYQQGLDTETMNDTATGVSIITEQGNNRFALKVRLAEMMGWSKIGFHFGSILQQFTTTEQIVRLLGPDGQAMWESFDPEALQGRLDYDIESASTVQTETVRKEQAMSLLQMGAQFLGEMDPLAILPLWRDVVEAFDKKNVEEYMPQIQPPEEEMAEEGEMLPPGVTAEDLAEMPPELAQMGPPEEVQPEEEEEPVG